MLRKAGENIGTIADASTVGAGASAWLFSDLRQCRLVSAVPN